MSMSQEINEESGSFKQQIVRNDLLDGYARKIARLGGSITVRDATRKIWALRGGAWTSLEAMVQNGYGIWCDVPAGPKGGRPCRVFVLHLDLVETLGATEKSGTFQGDGQKHAPRFRQ
jgi:hypothetical protein